MKLLNKSKQKKNIRTNFANFALLFLSVTMDFIFFGGILRKIALAEFGVRLFKPRNRQSIKISSRFFCLYIIVVIAKAVLPTNGVSSIHSQSRETAVTA